MARVLGIGCGSSCISRLLAGGADEVVALEVSPLAIARAGSLSTGPEGIDFRVANIIEYDLVAEGPWDLIVMSEINSYFKMALIVFRRGVAGGASVKSHA
jgi:methylase of polypeptide subunit release factors